MIDFEKFEMDRTNVFREEYVVYENINGKILKKTYIRKYIENSKNGFKDVYESEVL